MNENTDTLVETIENARLDDVRAGDHLTWTSVRKHDGVTITERREGIAYRRDGDGDWVAKSGVWITAGIREGVTLTIRRPVRELPTKDDGTVIVPNDGHEAIEARKGGYAYRASEAVLDTDGRWYGVWRREDGRRVSCSVGPEHITAPTWKVADQ